MAKSERNRTNEQVDIFFQGNHIEKIIREAIDVARGKKEFIESKDIKTYERVWMIIEKMLLRKTELQNLRAQSTTDIIKLLARGKITIQEAKDLMMIMESKFNIEELPGIMEKLEEMENDK